MTKDERKRLDELSLKAFGTSSKWKKLIEKGELLGITSKNKKGETIKVRTYERVTVEQAINIMNEMIVEKEKEKQEKAMQTLADEAQKLDLGYNSNDKKEE